MQSVNEELQSTNEELETSKEELQSTNEELVTVNSELQDKMVQLVRINDDMNNLLNATDIATIFLDAELRIKWFTPAAAKIINLIQTDIGRPLDDLRKISDTDVTALTREVLKSLNTVEKVILARDNIWYSLRIVPYRTVENLIDGAVITFFDVQRIKQAESMTRFGTVLRDSADAIMVLDFDGDIRAWNRGAELMYGWSESEALNMNINSIVPVEKADETRLFLGALKNGKGIKAFKTVRVAKDGRSLNVWVVATVLEGQNGKPEEIATTERDLEWLTGTEQEISNERKESS